MSRGLVLGFARGLGSQLEQRRKSEEEEQKRTREEQSTANKNYSSFLENLLNLDTVPDHAKDSALNGLFRIMTTPGGLATKDLENMGMELTRSIAMPRPVLGGQQTPRQGAGEPGITGTSGALPTEPMAGLSGAAEGLRGTQPEARMTSGLISREENDRYKQQLAAQAQTLAQPRYSYQKGPDGMYIYSDGKLVSKTPFPEDSMEGFNANTLAKRHYALSVQAWKAKNPGMELPTEVEQQMIADAQHVVGTADDRPPRPPSPWQTMGPGVQVQNPDGTVSIVYPLPVAQGREDVMPTVNIGRPKLSDAAKDKKTNLEKMLQSARSMVSLAANNPGAIGPYDNITGKIGEYTDWNSVEENWLRATVTDLASQLGLLRSGQAVSEPEARRLATILPQLGKGEKNFSAKLDRFIKELEFIYQRRYGADGIGDATTFSGDVGLMTGGDPAANARSTDLLSRITPNVAGGSVVPARPGADNTPPPAQATAGPQVGDIKTLPDGRRVEIVAIDPNTGKAKVRVVK